MAYFDEQMTVTSEYRLPIELSSRLEQAAVVFEVEEETIVIQALREFFEKHGIRASRIEA